VEKAKIERCLEAARLSPSACNSQPWRFIVVDNPELKNAIADTTSSRIIGINHFTKQAPVHIVVVREQPNFSANVGGLIWCKDYTHYDIGIATGMLCLQATELGLGTCILGWFNGKKVKKILNIPRTKKVELIITLGYPASEEIRSKKRKLLEEVCSYNTY
jgi:nitroreductase